MNWAMYFTSQKKAADTFYLAQYDANVVFKRGADNAVVEVAILVQGMELVGKKDVRNHLGKEQGIKDQHERDLDFQKSVAKTYISFTKSRPDWIMINCAPKGKLLSKEEVHALVLKEINKVLKK